MPVVIEEEELEAAGSFCFVLNNFRVLEELSGQCVLCRMPAFLAEMLSPWRKSQGLERGILQAGFDFFQYCPMVYLMIDHYLAEIQLLPTVASGLMQVCSGVHMKNSGVLRRLLLGGSTNLDLL